jgi:DNA-binding phage protein
MAHERKAPRRTTEKFSKYDAADYLKSDEDMAAYLEAAMEERATTRRSSRPRSATSRALGSAE